MTGLMPQLSAKKGHLIFLFVCFHEFLSTVNTVTVPCVVPCLPPRDGATRQLAWLVSCQTTSPNYIKEKRKLLQSCTGSHSNAAVPIFKILKDSKNIKSEGREKKNQTRFYQKEKKMQVFLTGSSDETAYG